MLKKRDLKDVYTNIMITHEVFSTIVKKNLSLEEEFLKSHPQISTEIEKEKILSAAIKQRMPLPTEQYLLNHVDINMKIIFLDLFAEMEKYNFQSDSSVPKNIKNISFGEGNLDSKRYELLSRISLEEHSFNAAICAIEVCEKYEIPKLIMQIIIVLAILHDFGKSPKIESEYVKKGENYKHHVVSSIYARIHLKKYSGNLLNEETYLQIVEILKVHHDLNVQNNAWLELLRKADGLARKKEEEFALNREKSGEI